MHEGRDKGIELIMSLHGLTFEQASKVVDRQNRIDQIRSEAEAFLGAKFPAAVSSKFIERFYEDAPKIAVWVEQWRLCLRDSSNDWRFMNLLDFTVHEDPSPKWFSVWVIQNPDIILHVTGSPAQVLAEFIRQVSEICEGAAPSQIKRLNAEVGDRVIALCTGDLAKSVSNLKCRVETVGGQAHEKAIGYESQSLREILQHESVVPSRVPKPGVVHDICLAHGLPFSVDKLEQAYQDLKSTMRDQFSSLVLYAGEALMQTLGQGQLSSPVVSSKELYDTLLGESRETLEASKRKVAMAFLDEHAAISNVDISAATYDANQVIDAGLEKLDFLIERVEERLLSGGAPSWEGQELDETLRAYYRYVKGAITDNREALVKLLSS